MTDDITIDGGRTHHPFQGSWSITTNDDAPGGLYEKYDSGSHDAGEYEVLKSYDGLSVQISLNGLCAHLLINDADIENVIERLAEISEQREAASSDDMDELED